ncbi:MAG: flagellar hook protein [Lachnospiraceae bacterium]|nr:flagellar hook protein [Lachnospiraceae bacterium]
MVVQHNLTAMNSNRMLGLTTSAQAKSTEKLSSGYKINRAADDAAGLSISEKMRKQIRGLTQASANANDGISAVQTAEGALGEVQDMLQRMNELAVKAANGTNSEDDRNYIQNEIDQLTTEIDRVSETTKFNESYLLKGDRDVTKNFSLSYQKANAASSTTSAATATFEANADANGFAIANLAASNVGDNAKSDDVNTVLKAIRDQGVTVTWSSHYNQVTNQAENGITFELNGDAATKYKVVVDPDGTGTPNNMFKIQTKEGVDVLKGITVTAPTSTVATLSNLDLAISSKISAIGVTAQVKDGVDTVKYYDRDGNGIPENALDSYFSVTPPANQGGDATIAPRTGVKAVYDAVGNEVTINASAVSAKQDIVGALQLKIHVGADATGNNQIALNIDSMTAKSLGVSGLKVSGTDDRNARNAIETVKEAIQKVSTQRSTLGAIQNRLEHTIKNLDNVVENTTAAEAQIRDTDMANEMVRYSNNNILAQAGQSMLAQANQTNQGVLSLLQG